jgi:hypothetical protein
LIAVAIAVGLAALLGGVAVGSLLLGAGTPPAISPLPSSVAGRPVTTQPPGPVVPTGVPVSPTASQSSEATPEPLVNPSGPVLPVPSEWAMPDGWSRELDCEEDSGDCILRRFDGAGHEPAGWPVVLPVDCWEPVGGPDSTTFIACDDGARMMSVYGIDASGRILPGWPVRLAGFLTGNTWNSFDWGELPPLAVGPDGTVYVAVERRGACRVHAYSVTGTRRPGWPVRIPGDIRGFRPAADGALLAWWYEGVHGSIGLDARRTVFTMLGADGETLNGWPIGSKGAASGPVAWDDGSIAYVSARGRAYRHDASGRIETGWPRQVGAVPPTLRADGMLLLVGEQKVTVLDLQGRTLAGWPREAAGMYASATCDTPGWIQPLMALGRDDVLFLLDRRAREDRLLAVDRDGGMVDGWPFRVPAGWAVTGLWLAPDGSLDAGIAGGPCEVIDATTIRVARDGALVGEPPGSPQQAVYEAFRLASLATSTGQSSAVSGTAVAFTFDLVNTSDVAITLPLLSPDAGYEPMGEEAPFFSFGLIQTWIRRLDGAPLDGCLPAAGRKGPWYATGGWRNDHDPTITIKPGGTVPLLFSPSLDEQLTACLAPGTYRYRVEYGRLDDEDWEYPLDHATVDVEIVAPESP